MLASTYRRRYRHAVTGEDVHLTPQPLPGPCGQMWWEIVLVRADGGCGTVAGQPYIAHFLTLAQAREGLRERLRALRQAGYRRVA